MMARLRVCIRIHKCFPRASGPLDELVGPLGDGQVVPSNSVSKVPIPDDCRGPHAENFSLSGLRACRLGISRTLRLAGGASILQLRWIRAPEIARGALERVIRRHRDQFDLYLDRR